MTADITINGDGIIIERNNIILDGKDHTITGKKWGTGVILNNVGGVTVKTCT